MQELSMNVLDIAQNSISAGAGRIDIVINEDIEKDLLSIVISDNGKGMTEEQVERVSDPFYTTRSTRQVGLGVPLFKMAAEMTGGRFLIESEPGVGTTVSAEFGYSHIDRAPLGDISATITQLMCLNESIDVTYTHYHNGEEFSVSTQEIRQTLDGLPMNTPQVMQFLESFVKENTHK